MGRFKRKVGRLWHLVTMAEGAHAVYTWALPLVPAGIGGTLAAFAQQQGWVVWLVAISSYATFAVGRYFVSKYVKENTLSGAITVVPLGTHNDNFTNEGVFKYSIQNMSDRLIYFRSKITLKAGGQIYEQDDFDENSYLMPEKGATFFWPPESIGMQEKWSVSFHVEYGASPDDLNMVVKGRAESSGPGYEVKELVFSPKHMVG